MKIIITNKNKNKKVPLFEKGQYVSKNYFKFWNTCL